VSDKIKALDKYCTSFWYLLTGTKSLLFDTSDKIAMSRHKAQHGTAQQYVPEFVLYKLTPIQARTGFNFWYGSIERHTVHSSSDEVSEMIHDPEGGPILPEDTGRIHIVNCSADGWQMGWKPLLLVRAFQH
jgi:hypothetical protein